MTTHLCCALKANFVFTSFSSTENVLIFLKGNFYFAPVCGHVCPLFNFWLLLTVYLIRPGTGLSLVLFESLIEHDFHYVQTAHTCLNVFWFFDTSFWMIFSNNSNKTTELFFGCRFLHFLFDFLHHFHSTLLSFSLHNGSSLLV